MTTLSLYRAECERMSEEEFCRAHANPFLVHSSLDSGSMKPVARSPGMTLDRLIVEKRAGAVTGESIDDWFHLFELFRGDGPSIRLALGCSTGSDVRVNDESISTAHAVIERRGDLWRIEDSGSAGGTQVNGALLEPGVGRDLVPCDSITLGYVELLFLPPAHFYRFVKSLFAR